MVIKYLLLLSVSILFLQCHTESSYYLPISSELKTYLDYKEGSYWIYKNPESGIEDSTFVRNYSKYDSTIVYQLRRDMFVGTTEDVAATREEISYSQNLITENGKITLRSFSFQDYGRDQDYEAFFSSDSIGFTLFGLNKSNQIEGLMGASASIVSSIVVNNTTYYEVLKCDFYYSDWSIQNIYIKKGIGIIKFELKDNSTRELVRYNVVK